MDFKDIVNCIFLNKNQYSNITDIDKINNFFIINRKFSRKYPKISQFLNNKSIDKSTALDKWFVFFKNENKIPQWYWGNKTKNNKKNNIKNIKKEDIILLMDKLDLKENDINFMNKYYNNDLLKYLKRLKK